MARLSNIDPCPRATGAEARADSGSPYAVIDPTFGSSGKVTTAFGTNAAAIYALALQSAGKIVAAGLSLQSLEGGQVGGLVVARYLGQ